MEYTNISAPEAPKEEQSTEVHPYKVTITTDGMSVLMSNALVQEAFQDHMNKLLREKSEYNNPVKKVISDIFSGYGKASNPELKGEFDKLVANQMKAYMATPSFQLQLGQAMAEEMAKRAVDKLMPTK